MYKRQIINGGYPDPSIVRVDDDFYVVNSSFEYFPALPIHHSKDLVNWELIGYGIDRPSQATGKVKEVFEDIKSSRGITEIPNFWKSLANNPETLERTWTSLQQVMKKGALDEMTKELIYVAVSMTNSCEYCIKSHSIAAKKQGASK